jgi:uncharacterized membrane protein
MEATTNQQSRLIGAVCYLGFFVTGLIFLMLEPYNKDEYVRFHARQSIVYSLAFVALWIVVAVFLQVLPGPLAGVLSLLWRLVEFLFAVYWVFLMYKAYKGERYRIPQLADWAEGMNF